MPDVDEWGDSPDDLIEDGVKIVKLLDVGDTFDYQYDNGRNWQRFVVLVRGPPSPSRLSPPQPGSVAPLFPASRTSEQWSRNFEAAATTRARSRAAPPRWPTCALPPRFWPKASVAMRRQLARLSLRRKAN